MSVLSRGSLAWRHGSIHTVFLFSVVCQDSLVLSFWRFLPHPTPYFDISGKTTGCEAGIIGKTVKAGEGVGFIRAETFWNVRIFSKDLIRSLSLLRKNMPSRRQSVSDLSPGLTRWYFASVPQSSGFQMVWFCGLFWWNQRHLRYINFQLLLLTTQQVPLSNNRSNHTEVG